GIPLMNTSEFLEMDPYEEVVQQGQAHPLSPAYVQDPMKLDDHMSVHVLEQEHQNCEAEEGSDNGCLDCGSDSEAEDDLDNSMVVDEGEQDFTNPTDR
nr:hypothetical protein [Tanacetum cinerariifolium]